MTNDNTSNLPAGELPDEQLSCAIPLDKVEYSELSTSEQEQILQLQQSILTSLAQGGDPQDIINQLCKLEEQLLPNSVASVMLLDEATHKLNVFAAPSVPAVGINQLNGLRPGPGGGSCGNAVYRNEPVFVGNTFTDSRWSNIRHIARDFNLRACWSMPIFSASEAGKAIGSFALSSFEHRLPSPFHRKLLEIGASIVGIVLDRSKSQENLRLFAKVFAGSEEGIMITDRDGKIVSINEAFSKVLGYSFAEVRGNTPAMLASGLHDAAFYRTMWDSIASTGHWRGEIWNKRKDGEVFPEWLSISSVNDESGNLSHYIGIFTDLSKLRSAEAQVAFLSQHDPLTGLANREHFRDHLALTLPFAARMGQKLAVMHMNIDNFKGINDSFGHSAGDAVLRQIGERLSKCACDTDIVSRSGGNDFLICLGGVSDVNSIHDAAGKVMELLEEPVPLGEHQIPLSCSIGIAVYPDDGVEQETLLSKADTALRHAKTGGRNSYRFYSEQMNLATIEHLRIAAELKQAVKQHEFVLYYQPQIELASGRCIGAEALIRWNHPRDGLLAPGHFIGIAEQRGLIVEIGAWVLQQACEQAMAWQQAGLPPIVVAVNLSALQFSRGNLAQTVANALQHSGLAPERLELEITESILLHDINEVLATVEQLKTLGVKLSVDDFGTGYSSLTYLKRLKVDKLKIDQSFVRDMVSNQESAAIARAVIQMAKAMNLRTVAEGVEDAATLEQLRQAECEEAQGYYLARPLPATELEKFLQQNILSKS